MARRTLTRVALSAFGVVMALIVLELGLRLWFWTRGTEQERAMYIYDRATVDAKTYEFAGVPFLNYTLNPNYTDVDARGIRGPMVVVPKPKGVFRILAIGGSTTYGGGGLTARQAWPFQLQIILRNQYGYNVQVVNLGVPSYISLNSLISLETRGLALQPDLVIEYDGVNDALARIYADPICYSGDTPLFGLGANQGIWQSRGRDLPPSALYRFVAIRLGWMENPINLESRLVPTSFCPPEREDGRFSYRLSQNPPVYFERNLRSIAAIAQANGAKTLFLTFAWDTDAEKKALAADPSLDGTRALLAAVDQQNALVPTIASDTGSLFLDLSSEMAKRAATDSDPFFQDDHVHQTIHGSQRQAEILAAFLDAQGVIPK